VVRCEDAGGRWRFSVADNGPGIDPKYHEKVFRIFQTLAPRDQQESTGIGLTLVKRIVELYGGQVQLAAEAGQGCTFTFTLPK
jgi:two-component system, LuxR family, sensor kinase FixL